MKALLKSLLQVPSINFVIIYTSPLFILPLIPLAVFFFTIMNLHNPPSKQFRKMEKDVRSTIYSFIAKCCAGSETVRAFAKEEYASGMLSAKLDRFTRCKIVLQCSDRWLCYYTDQIENLVVRFSALCAVISCGYFGVAPALAGLSLSYAFSMHMLDNVVEEISRIEHCKIDAERLRDYSSLAKELLAIERTMEADWIAHPRIEFDNICIRYAATLPLVLCNVSFSIAAREKVAVIGRTGSGKSSLTMALFRMIDPFSGCIRIGGIDISAVDLSQLRGALAIIPQDPVLFSGSLRANLDPFGTCSDKELWKAMEQCHMKETIDNLGGLDCKIDDSGKNLSVGQRQLLCLARVLIRRVNVKTHFCYFLIA
ncbi:hypothetical protein PMAYCL1PPCAC_27659 [Pristionchus mayeri]|uniref:ABC transmembrane type-1 domain-containing protein n=1 Tax=Pristionchus mayeri TaxID=1317129 RepID=A0AAN5IAF8_9BILA|nr:hypothetical protein PMAYCL1PPCAC_27659 [Pristionchus mayeri]